MKSTWRAFDLRVIIFHTNENCTDTVYLDSILMHNSTDLEVVQMFNATLSYATQKSSVQCHTFLILFIVYVCLGTVAKCINIIWFSRQHLVATTEGIVNVFSLHVRHRPFTSLQDTVKCMLLQATISRISHKNLK